MSVFVDTNVLIDALYPESEWHAWSSAALARHENGGLAVTSIVVAELAGRYATPAALQNGLTALGVDWVHTSLPGLHRAAEAFKAYRGAGGPRTTILPDLLIGAEAAVRGKPLLTRDPRRHRAYLPELTLIAPDSAP